MSSENSNGASPATSPVVDPRTVASREDFVEFLRTLTRDFREHSEDWENADLSSYLEAMAAWSEDMAGYYAGSGESVPEHPTWKVLAEILAAARVYE